MISILLIAATSDIHEVPFHWLKPGIPIICFEAKINGQGPFKLVLDTGNGETLILSKHLPAKLMLETKPARQQKGDFTVGTEGKPSFETSKVASLQVGGQMWRNVDGLVSDLVDRLGEKLDVKHDGNFGYGLIKDQAVTVDYREMKLRFDTAPVPSKEGSPFKLAKEAPLIVVEASINGKEPHPFVLDTGASATVISRKLGKELGLKELSEVPMLGAAGADKGFLSKASVKLGGRERKGLSVVLADFVEDLAKAIETPIAGIVGYDVLKGASLSIDYRNRRIVLKDEPSSRMNR